MRAQTRAPFRDATRTAIVLFFFILSVYLLTMGGHTYAPDDETFYYVAEAILTRGDFDIPDPESHPTVGGLVGREGKLYAQSALGQPLLATPFYLGGSILASAFDARFAGILRRGIMGLLNPLVTAAVALVLLAYARALGWSTRTGAALALIWAFATPAWIEAKTFYNEPLMALLLLLSFYFLKRAQQTGARAKFALASVFWGMSMVARIHAAVALPALLIYFVMLTHARAPRGIGRMERAEWFSIAREFLLFLVPGLCIVTVGALGYNWYRFGNPLEFGYGDSLYGIEIWTGIYGLLFSSGKSWFLYVPPLVMSLLALPRFGRAHRPETLAVLVYFFSLVLFHARYNFWHSDGAWGNRYLLAGTALWMLPLGEWFEGRAHRLARAGLTLTVAAGVMVQLLAVAINFDVYLNQNPIQSRRSFEPASAPILAHARLLNERARTWWQVWNAPPPRAILLDGWLGSDGAAGELFPRFAAARARVGVAANENTTVRGRIVTADYRDANLPPRSLEILHAGKKIETGVMQSNDRASVVYAFAIPPPHPPLVWLTLETRGSNPRGDSPMGDELGLHVQEIVLTVEDEPIEFFPEIAIPPNPSMIPKASWSWFYNPQLPHWDFWWWYLYFSGLPRTQVWNFAAPVLLVLTLSAVVSGVWLGKYFLTFKQA